jgi:putative two-component system response regulator
VATVLADVPQRPAILVVDDEATMRAMLQKHLIALGYRVATADSASTALEQVESSAPDLVLTDVHMPGMSGIELCARLKRDPRFELTPVVILTAVSDRNSRVAGLAAGADDFFAKPVDLMELQTRVSVLVRVKFLVDQLDRAESVLSALGNTIEARDPYTAGHCERLSGFAVRLGQALGCDGATLRALRLGGFLHDLGKIAVPDAILLKPGRLDPRERAGIERHPVAGADLVQALRTLDTVRPIIRHHHERWDGSGYPDGLRAEAIPLGARIMAVVDVYDALRTTRPYKGPLSREEARAILLRETEAGAWEPRIVTAFLGLLSDGGTR